MAQVYEMSRLNVAYTVLSKRKLLKLVTSGVMRGWNDPRMPTIKGLRRRGFSAEIMNAFCCEIGVTRNENTVEYEKLTSV
jgi:glutaminyl-tRNA synthetase